MLSSHFGGYRHWKSMCCPPSALAAVRPQGRHHGPGRQGNKYREVPVHNDLREHLAVWINERTPHLARRRRPALPTTATDSRCDPARDRALIAGLAGGLTGLTGGAPPLAGAVPDV